MDQPLPSREQGIEARDLASWEAQHIPERAEAKGGIVLDFCWSCSQFAGTGIVFPCMVSRLIARVRELEGALREIADDAEDVAREPIVLKAEARTWLACAKIARAALNGEEKG